MRVAPARRDADPPAARAAGRLVVEADVAGRRTAVVRSRAVSAALDLLARRELEATSSRRHGDTSTSLLALPSAWNAAPHAQRFLPLLPAIDQR